MKVGLVNSDRARKFRHAGFGRHKVERVTSEIASDLKMLGWMRSAGDRQPNAKVYIPHFGIRPLQRSVERGADCH